MRIKEPKNNLYRKYQRKLGPSWTFTLNDYKEKFKWFFTGENLEKVQCIEIIEKQTLYWVTVTTITENGERPYKIKIRKPWGDNKPKSVIEGYDDTPVMSYETVEDFMEDFVASTEKDFQILETYRKNLKKKEKQIEEEIKIRDNIQTKYPEFFL
jgi:hypothetical protein